MSESVLPHTDPMEVLPLEPSASETEPERVGEFDLVGNDRRQGALCEGAMADLAAPRADTPHLAGGERWEVVVVDVALAVIRAEAVKPLFH